MSNINEREKNGGSIDNTAINNTAIDANGNGNSLDDDKGDTVNNTATDTNGTGDLAATDTTTDTTTVQPSTQTVRFERISNGTCDLTFTPTDTTDNGEITTTTTVDITSKEATDTTDTTTTQPNSVSISNVSFPYEFDPSEHGFDSVNGKYKFDCCGCPYEFVIEGEDITTTTTTEKDVSTTTTTEKDVTTTTTEKDVSTTTSSSTSTTTTIKEGCNNCTTVRVRKANVKTPTTVTFNYTDCDNVSQSETLTRQRTTVDLCVCSDSIPSSDDYSIEFIETCTTGLPVLTCDLLQLTVNDGEAGENVSYVNGSGLLIPAQVTPAQYNLLQRSYTVTVTVPSGYSNEGDTLSCVTDDVTVTQGGGDTTTTSTKGSSNAYCAKVTYGNNSPNNLRTSQGGEILNLQIDQMFTYQYPDGNGGFFRVCSDNGAFLVVEGNNSPRAIQESDDLDIEFNEDDLCNTDTSGNIDCVQRI